MDVIHVLKHGLVLLFKDFIVLVVSGVLVVALAIVTFGILGGPLIAGWTRMVLRRAREDRKPGIADLFYFEKPGRYILAFYVLAILMTIGYILFLVPGLYLEAIWFYVFILMVDQDVGVRTAMSRSKALVDRIGIWDQVLLILLLIVISLVPGILTRGLTGAFTGPLWITCAVAAYHLTRTHSQTD